MKKLLLITCGLAITAAVEAQIIHVPGDYPTIQQGIDAATNGDTVLVSDGTYYEQINFLGKKPLMVASQFIMDGDTNHIANTIIDGSQLTILDSASVVYFISGEDTTSILCGFTVTHGKGTIYTIDNYILKEGGGIFISGSGAKIIHNHITENNLNDTLTGYAQLVGGAGIDNEWKEDDHMVVVDHNVIDYNSCYSSGIEAFGAGISICYNARITNNTISHNSSIVKQYCQATAALDCATGLDWTIPVNIVAKYNIISNNYCETQYSDAAGAGAYFQAVSGIFSFNIVEHNEVNTMPYSGGAAGLHVYDPKEGTLIRNNIFRENTGDFSAGGLHLKALSNDPEPDTVLVENNYFLDNESSNGGAFVTTNIPVTLQNNVFGHNHASQRGGAIYLNKDSNFNIVHLAALINNSFYGNIANSQGGAIFSSNAKPIILNSIFWADSAVMGKEIYGFTSETIEMAYSNIDSNFVFGNFLDGGGNINQDPLFEDPELLTISENSPCINTGIEEYICNCGQLHTCPTYDILDNLRPLNGYFDMGAYERLITGIDYKLSNKTKDWHSVYPNPFTGEARLSYELDKKTQVEINLYNSSGELIQTLLSEQQEAGNQELQFSSGNLPAGIYFYRITTDSKQATGKMILLK